MGRRAKRMSRETAFRQRLEACPAPLRTSIPTQDVFTGKIRMQRTNAVTEWAIKVFHPKNDRFPTEAEMLAAMDSGTIGHWIDEQTKPRVIKREGFTKGDKIVRKKDMHYANEMAAMHKDNRETRWKAESESETIAAAIAGKLGEVTVDTLTAEAARIYADKKRRWDIEQAFTK